MTQITHSIDSEPALSTIILYFTLAIFGFGMFANLVPAIMSTLLANLPGTKQDFDPEILDTPEARQELQKLISYLKTLPMPINQPIPKMLQDLTTESFIERISNIKKFNSRFMLWQDYIIPDATAQDLDSFMSFAERSVYYANIPQNKKRAVITAIQSDFKSGSYAYLLIPLYLLAIDFIIFKLCQSLVAMYTDKELPALAANTAVGTVLFMGTAMTADPVYSRHQNMQHREAGAFLGWVKQVNKAIDAEPETEMHGQGQKIRLQGRQRYMFSA